MEATGIKLHTLMLSTAAVLLVELTAKVTWFEETSSYLVSLAIVRLVEIILLSVILFKQGPGPAALGLDRPAIGRGLLRGLLWSLGFGGLVLAGWLVFFLLGINPFNLLHVQLPERQRDLILFCIVGGTISPVAEEIFFRGILYGFLRRWGIVTALSVSTLIFVLIHPLGRTVPLTQAVGGVLFALSYEIEKSLMTPIVIHALGNLAIFVIGIIR